MKLMWGQLKDIAGKVNGELFPSTFPYEDELSFVAVIAGAGEVQLDINGAAWYFQWDRTHAVSVEKELNPPDTDDTNVLAAWLAQTVAEFDNAVF